MHGNIKLEVTIIMANVTLEMSTNLIPVVDFGTYWGSLHNISEDVFSYWAIEPDNLDPTNEDEAEALQLYEEQYDGHDDFLAQVQELAPEFIQQSLDDYGIPAKVVGDCRYYHPREYNFGDDYMIFDMSIDTNWVETTYAELVQDDAFVAFIKKHYSSRSGFISFFPNTVEEFDEIIRPDSDNYYKVVAAICHYIVESDASIAENSTADLVEYLYESGNFTTFSQLGIY